MLVEVLPWYLSASSIYASWMVGNKAKWIFKFKVANQFAWLLWVVLAAEWGLLPMSLFFICMYFRNDRKWNNAKEISSEETNKEDSEEKGWWTGEQDQEGWSETLGANLGGTSGGRDYPKYDQRIPVLPRKVSHQIH